MRIPILLLAYGVAPGWKQSPVLLFFERKNGPKEQSVCILCTVNTNAVRFSPFPHESPKWVMAALPNGQVKHHLVGLPITHFGDSWGKGENLTALVFLFWKVRSL